MIDTKFPDETSVHQLNLSIIVAIISELPKRPGKWQTGHES